MNGERNHGELDGLGSLLTEIADSIDVILKEGDNLFESELYDPELKAFLKEACEEQRDAIEDLRGELVSRWEEDSELRSNLAAAGLTGAQAKAKRGVLRKLKELLKRAKKRLPELLDILKAIAKSLSKALSSVPQLALIAEAIAEITDILKAIRKIKNSADEADKK